MQPEQAERLAELVEHAFDLEGGERTAFLARACGDDVDLRAEAEARPGVDVQRKFVLHHPQRYQREEHGRGRHGARPVLSQTEQQADGCRRPDRGRATWKPIVHTNRRRCSLR